ncbi:hypothetical protein BK126_03805 [Paenibacillus sp. FSL H7-0326]|uniref:DUF92 domain-containing protein n=1 Tax=Paenibacillus sp. FSL H7-0326 TaxID=1921144 RepID=UPI00096C877B|nr:DUF92 domain-containing protein [Paenibacillus sp. FSL H7-0326]OMC71239.1 hypothetical protein BK126_03805 [Paenibacillus sp. FSL H7-0326]
MDWIIGTLCAFLVAGAAYYKRSLTLSGSIAAVIMGAVYYGAGDLMWFGTLLLFFITSTVLSKYKKREKQELEQSYAKTGNRDAGQVLANGGLGMVLVLLHAIFPDPVWIYAFIGIMATVTADTWATEIGSLSSKPPRSVRTWNIIPPGSSGGVTVTGNAAAAAGALMIGGCAYLFLVLSSGAEGSLTALIAFAIIGVVSGFIGAYADSLMGATIQRMYHCNVCGKDVEVHHHCGQNTVRGKGLNWMSNDLVNLFSSLIGGGIAILLGWLLL